MNRRALLTLIGTVADSLPSLTLTLSVGAQPPEHRDDQYKDDPHAFCWRGPRRL